jgi:hypothetical protein
VVVEEVQAQHLQELHMEHQVVLVEVEVFKEMRDKVIYRVSHLHKDLQVQQVLLLEIMAQVAVAAEVVLLHLLLVLISVVMVV